MGLLSLGSPLHTLSCGYSALQALCLRGQLVVLRWQRVEYVANRLEEDVETRLALYRPEDASVLEPCVGKDAVEAPEDVDEVLDRGALIMSCSIAAGQCHKPRREEFGVRHDVGSPVEGVAAVVNSTA